MVRFETSGDFKNTFKFLNKLTDNKYLANKLDAYGEEGVRLLSAATPVDTGLTASSWGYQTKIGEGFVSITWTNSNTTPNGIPIVILLQYGHGTRGGGYVQGRDFINPAVQPLFDRIADELWKEVTKV